MTGEGAGGRAKILELFLGSVRELSLPSTECEECPPGSPAPSTAGCRFLCAASKKTHSARPDPERDSWGSFVLEWKAGSSAREAGELGWGGYLNALLKKENPGFPFARQINLSVQICRKGRQRKTPICEFDLMIAVDCPGGKHRYY